MSSDNAMQRAVESCSCAQELRALETAVEQLKTEMEGRMQQQEQALGKALATILPAVESLSVKMDRRQTAAESPASAALLAHTADAAQPSRASSSSGPAPEGTPALHAAATAGDTAAVRRLLARGDDPTARDALGNSALHCAAAGGYVATLDALLDAVETKAPQAARAEWVALAANARGQKFRTPLHAAAKAGHADAACSLLAAGAHPDAADAEGVTPLHLATWKGHSAVATLLLAEGAAVDPVNKDELTPLDTSFFSGHNDLLQLMLCKGANLHRRDAQQLSVLHRAAAFGDRQAVVLLLERGMDVLEKNAVGLTALHIAANGGNVEVIETLLERGADVDAGIDEANTPLMLAVLGGHAEAVEKLLEKGANIREPVIKTGDSNNPYPITHNFHKMYLVAAARGGNPNVVKTLFKSGANAIPVVLQYALERARNADVVWALADVTSEYFRQVAEEALTTLTARGNVAALRAVLSAGVNVVCERCVSALRLAAENDQADCVSVLLDAGVADEEQVALHTAVRLGHEKSVRVFLERGLSEAQKNEALSVARDHSQVAVMRALVDAGADPFLVDAREAWEYIKDYAKQKARRGTTETLNISHRK